MNVTIAIIDSGIDASIRNWLIRSRYIRRAWQQAGATCPGTAIAGTIAARARADGECTGVRILAIRAFGAVAGGAGDVLCVLRSLDYAVLHGARS